MRLSHPASSTSSICSTSSPPVYVLFSYPPSATILSAGQPKHWPLCSALRLNISGPVTALLVFSALLKIIGIPLLSFFFLLRDSPAIWLISIYFVLVRRVPSSFVVWLGLWFHLCVVPSPLAPLHLCCAIPSRIPQLVFHLTAGASSLVFRGALPPLNWRFDS